ncbi:hypothetical protein L7F22_035163 [Adiantum nelumboides]|nr:hypothetical protein [Adiantum nelumboides]
MDRLGTPINTSSVFEGQRTSSTPIIGKLNLKIESYKDMESFLLAPLEGCDVILGMPWHYKLTPQPDFVARFCNKTLSFYFKEKQYNVTADAGDWHVPIANHIAIKKEIKKCVSAYLIFARERDECVLSSFSSLEQKILNVLNKYEDCFADSLPDELPPLRPEDHTIDVIPGSTPPNQPPYRVSLMQQEEILKQVNELLETGLIRPSTSPYCSPVLLVHLVLYEKYPLDPHFAQIWNNLRAGQTVAPYSIKDDTLYHHHAICIVAPLRHKVMQEAHDSPYVGHRGTSATTNALKRYFYWPTLRADIEKYVRECLVCQKVKHDRHKVYGKLKPLRVPDKPWESIAMDCITDLPRSKNGNDAIWIIIDRFSKQAHFLPIKKTIKADHMAKTFLAQIFKRHGMPKSIVSDRDPRMTSLFWQSLFENLGTKLDFSSAYHPQTDGQSEIANATVIDLLKSYVSDRQSEWEKYLPLVEFVYNNTIHSSIGKAPFEVIYGKPHLPPILLTKEKIFAADEFVRDINTAYTQVQRAILRTQEK